MKLLQRRSLYVWIEGEAGTIETRVNRGLGLTRDGERWCVCVEEIVEMVN